MPLLPVMEGREYGWPCGSIVLPVLWIAVFAHFVSYEKRLRAAGGVPIIDIDLFANRRFVTGVIGVFVFYSSISFAVPDSQPLFLSAPGGMLLSFA